MKILITGAKGGIGYLTALTLAEKGHKVYLTCHTNKQLKKVKEKIGKQKNITVLKLDITSEKDRLRVLDLDIDCLFNNAAVALGGSIIEADMDYVRENFEVNVFSSFRLLQIVLRKMIEKNKGRIIVMSSLASMFPIPFSGVYSATKFAKLVILNCVLEPALNDATLMEKVGANTPEEVIEKCLLAGEQEELFKEIVKLSGFDKNINESIETAKN